MTIKAKDIKVELSKIVPNPESVEKLETLFNESVEAKATLISDKRVAAASEEIKNKYDLISEEFINARVEKLMTEEKKKLITEYDEKLVLVENKVNHTIDQFVEQEILPQLDNDKLGKIAINESLMPIVTGIKKIFEEHGVVINDQAKSILTEARNEIERLATEVNTLMKEKMVLNEKLEAVAKHLLIQEKTEGMTASKRKQVTSLFESRDFEETEAKIDSAIKLLTEDVVVEDDAPAAEGTDGNKADTTEDLTPPKVEVVKEEEETDEESAIINEEKMLVMASEYMDD